jgi:hypothetical protein
LRVASASLTFMMASDDAGEMTIATLPAQVRATMRFSYTFTVMAHTCPP